MKIATPKTSDGCSPTITTRCENVGFSNLLSTKHFPLGGGGLHKEVMKYAIPRMANNSAPTLLSSYGAGGVTVENLFKTSFRHKGAVLIIQRNETGNQ